MYSRLPAAFLILHTLVPAVVVAQGFDENSIPEPTQFSVVASEALADTTVVGSLNPIESDNSIAKFTVVEVLTSSGQRQRGVRILLALDGRLDILYLDTSQVSQLRDELAGFETWNEPGKTCEAKVRCVNGVARCRPSQNVRQAFCPSFYSTPEGEQGVLVSTPRYSFSFPSIEPSVFVSAIDATIAELDR